MFDGAKLTWEAHHKLKKKKKKESCRGISFNQIEILNTNLKLQISYMIAGIYDSDKV
jgi:hypothetical protein